MCVNEENRRGFFRAAAASVAALAGVTPAAEPPADDVEEHDSTPGMCPRCEGPTRRFSDNSHMRVCDPCSQLRQRSPFVVQANRIVRMMEELRERITEFRDEHDEHCQCFVCKTTDEECTNDVHFFQPNWLLPDWRGVAWALRTGINSFHNVVTPLTDEKLKNFELELLANKSY